MVVSGNYLDWHINVLGSVSHGLIIDMSCSMLDWLVIDVGLSVFHWLILCLRGVVLVSLFRSIVVWSSIMVICNMSIKFSYLMRFM